MRGWGFLVPSPLFCVFNSINCWRSLRIFLWAKSGGATPLVLKGAVPLQREVVPLLPLPLTKGKYIGIGNHRQPGKTPRFWLQSVSRWKVGALQSIQWKSLSFCLLHETSLCAMWKYVGFPCSEYQEHPGGNKKTLSYQLFSLYYCIVIRMGQNTVVLWQEWELILVNMVGAPNKVVHFIVMDCKQMFISLPWIFMLNLAS